jgi:sugar O-acyltransferase (sialic acid O-acetyltransferase NeuD family)
MQSVALFGYSGHAFVVADAIKLMGHDILGYYDRTEAITNPFNIPYLGNEEEEDSLNKIQESGAHVFIGIGDNSIRQKLIGLLTGKGFSIGLIIHPKAVISSSSIIGEGSFVAAGAMVNPLAIIGKGIIINTGAIIEHECRIGDFAHIAPGAVLAGNVYVGEGSFIGANAVIKQGITIGKNVKIGAGSVVVKNVPDNLVLAGNPAIELKK